MSVSALPRLYTEAEVAEYLGLAVITLRRMRRRREIEFVKVGGKIKFTEAHLKKYLDKQQCPASELPTSIHSSSEPDHQTGTSNGVSVARKCAAVAAVEALTKPA